MIFSNGKNDFKNNTFDKFRWSANTYETAEEINTYLRDLGIFRKKVKGITAIGALIYYSVGRWKEMAIGTLRDAGIITQTERYERVKRKVTLCDGTVHDLGNCTTLMKNASTERSVELWEPLLIMFEDGDILELLPCATKGLRIGFNSLPKEMRNGVNQCEFDIGVIFNEFLAGNEIYKTNIVSSVATVTYGSNQNGEIYKRNEYRFGFSTGYLILEELQSSEYMVSFPNARNISYGDLAALGEKSYQDPVLEGCHGGGSLNIYPVVGTGWDEFHIDTDNPHAISVHYSEPALFSPLLDKYFDPELPINKECSQGHYDFYYWNFYTKEAIVKMVEEALCKLDEVRSLPASEQSKMLRCGYRGDTKAEKLIRIEEAISFTERFSERLLGMAYNTPGYNYISFMGP